MEFNLADLFECVADHVPARVALTAGDQELTFRALDERASRLAHGLAGLGVEPGDHVACYLHTCTEYLETMLACYKVRAVPFNVNDRYVADELAYVCADADAVVLVHHDDLNPHVRSAATRLPKLRATVEVGGDQYETLVEAGDTERDFGARSPDDRYLLYTGGATRPAQRGVLRPQDLFLPS